jgi:hypothetical protein
MPHTFRDIEQYITEFRMSFLQLDSTSDPICLMMRIFFAVDYLDRNKNVKILQ